MIRTADHPAWAGSVATDRDLTSTGEAVGVLLIMALLAGCYWLMMVNTIVNNGCFTINDGYLYLIMVNSWLRTDDL